MQVTSLKNIRKRALESDAKLVFESLALTGKFLPFEKGGQEGFAFSAADGLKSSLSLLSKGREPIQIQINMSGLDQILMTEYQVLFVNSKLL